MKTTLIFVLIMIAIIPIEGQSDLTDVSRLPYHLTQTTDNSLNGLVFFISGDGGYTAYDQSICTEFANKGYPVIGFDALKYFWERKDIVTVVADVQKLLSFYENLWHKSELIFVGYSFGADAVPVIVNRMEQRFKNQTKLIGLLSPSTSADLEIHIGDMLSINTKPGLYDLTNEINRLTFAKTICVFGENEKGEIRNTISNPNVKFAYIKGGHRFGSDFVKMADLILQKN